MVKKNVQSRAVLYETNRDFTLQGILRGKGEDIVGESVLLDRRLFPLAQQRLARWLHVHTQLAEGLSNPDGTHT